MTQLLASLLESVRREPGRVFLTLMGVSLGTASIVFLVALMGGASVALRKLDQRASGTDVSIVKRDDPSVAPGKTLLPLSVADAQALVEQSAVPTRMVYKYVKSQVNARVGDRTKVIGVDGGGSAFGRELDLELLHGRWLVDEEDGERVAMIGFGVWQDLFGGEWPLKNPRVVLDNGVSFHVVGVFAHRVSDGDGDGPETWKLDNKLRISNRTFLMALEPRSAVDEIVLRHADTGAPESEPKTIARFLDRYMENQHFGVRNFVFRLLDNRRGGLGEVIQMAIVGILSLAALLSLVVGGVNVMNAELMKLAERTREYGIRRALGASARELAGSLVAETVVFCVFGGVVGVVMGALGAFGLAALLTAVLTPWPFSLALWSVATALGASVVVGFLAGIVPAQRAQRLVIVECLRQAD